LVIQHSGSGWPLRLPEQLPFQFFGAGSRPPQAPVELGPEAALKKWYPMEAEAASVVICIA